jgi:hypothetical protein
MGGVFIAPPFRTNSQPSVLPALALYSGVCIWYDNVWNSSHIYRCVNVRFSLEHTVMRCLLQEIHEQGRQLYEDFEVESFVTEVQ